MAIVREQILAAIKTKLAAIAVPAGLQVYRNKTTEVDRFPALVVQDSEQEVISDQTQFARYQMTVGVTGFVQNTDEALIGSLVNELYGAVVAALLSDVTQGNLAIDTREESMTTEINEADDAKVTAVFAVSFKVEYATKYGQPAVLGPI